MKNKTTSPTKHLRKMRFRKKSSMLLWMFACLLLTSVKNSMAQIDPLEYPPGHPNVTVSAISQLQSFPTPRYKPGHTLLPNYNVMDPVYFGSRFQAGVSDAQAVTNSVTIQTELAKNFNYMVNVTWSNDNWNTAWINLANANPQWKVAMMTLRAQVGGTKMWYQNFANDHYLQNSSGQFLGWDGSVITSNKTWRPTAPIADYAQDGATVKSWINSALSGLTRNVDLVNEDGEVYPIIEDNGLQSDPAVVAAKNASGLSYQDFLAQKVTQNDNAYRNQFMSLSKLANAKYSEYRMDGHKTYQLHWEQTRFINSQINGQYYSTPDLYVRWPNNWQNWVSAWHGLKWVTQSRYYELAQGDKLFSPFVAAGWDANPENDVRPAQWLGLLKIMGMYGSEFYYTGYFNEAGSYSTSNPPYDPKGYAWQAVTPSYAQAITSRFENDMFRNGSLLAGDMMDNSNYNGVYNEPVPFYQFSTGASNKVVVIRKSNTGNKYAITGAIENTSNTIGSTPLVDDAAITLNGQSLRFKVRRQGSTYIYDNTVPSAPVFYQLDAWHESSHPCYWSKDFNFEAELYDNTNASYTIKTSVPAGTSAGDYRNFTSYITFPDAQTTFTPIEYALTPRDAANATYYLWVKMRSRVNGFTTGLTASLDNGTAKTISCVSDTTWQWYKIDATTQSAIVYSNLSLANHTLRLTPANSKLEIDQVILSINSNLGLTPVGPTCSSSCTATATANGATTFCQGGSVVLTASAGASYLWTPGNQTTQSITVSSSGSYSVRVTTSSGCSATSTSITVSANANPSATITPSGATTFCQGGSVTLTANSSSAYLWTPGNQTTQSITVSSSGSYSVRTTNSSGCTATSSAQSVTVNVPAVPVITPSGSTTIDQGQTVTLTASAGASYLWTPGGQTTQSITVGTADTYRVTVTYSNGCSAISAGTTVTVNVVPVTITVNGSSSICLGDSVQLTASAGLTYLWLPGLESTSSIYVKAGGVYTVQASNGTSANVTITMNDKPMVPSITTTYIPGSAYQLTAYEPSAVSYLWNNGQTVQTITMTSSGNVTVKATNSFGCVSDLKSMTVVNPVAAPCAKANMQTSFNIVDESATVSWNPAITADSFVVSYAPVGTSTYQYVTVPGNISNVVIGGLTAGTSYQWTVKTYCSGAAQTSNSATFTTLSGPLSCGSTPINCSTSNILQNTAKVNWYAASAQTYEVKYRKVGTASFVSKSIDAVAHPENTFLTGLAANTSYEWKIQSACNGNNSLWSSLLMFTTLDTCSPAGTIRKINVTYNSAMIGWDATAAADTFKIRYAVQGSTDYDNVTVLGNPNPGKGQIMNLLADTYYEIRVRTKCASGGRSAWSDVLVIHTDLAPVARIGADDPLKLNAYPNPVRERLNYAFITEKSSEYSVKITDMSGRVLLNTVRFANTGLNGDDLDVSKYANGIYMLIVEQGPSVSRFKFSIH
jgi:hypothetical protein